MAASLKSGSHIRRALIPLFLVALIVLVQVKIVFRHMHWPTHARHFIQHHESGDETYRRLQDSPTCFRPVSSLSTNNFVLHYFVSLITLIYMLINKFRVALKRFHIFGFFLLLVRHIASFKKEPTQIK